MENNESSAPLLDSNFSLSESNRKINCMIKDHIITSAGIMETLYTFSYPHPNNSYFHIISSSLLTNRKAILSLQCKASCNSQKIIEIGAPLTRRYHFFIKNIERVKSQNHFNQYYVLWSRE